MRGVSFDPYPKTMFFTPFSTSMMTVLIMTTTVMSFVGLVDLKSLRVTLDDTGDDDIDKFEVRDEWGKFMGRHLLEGGGSEVQ